MTTGNALRDFLVSRRAAIEPHERGLPRSTTNRRVPGLRREEVAILAGVSVDYYTKLEQGRVGTVSEQVLAAVEDALRLDHLERLHFRSLLHPDSLYSRRTPPATLKARPALHSMIHALDPSPSIIHGPHLEILGLNRAASILFDDFEAMPHDERNLARWMFLNPRARIVYRDWDLHAQQLVAILRNAAIEGVRNDHLTTLVGDLSLASPEFARFWADYRLFEHTWGVKVLFNEAVGEMTINYESLALPGDDGQTVVVYTADPGSPSAEKLQLLANWTAPEPARDSRAAMPSPDEV